MQEVDEEVARHTAAHAHPQRKRLRRKLGQWRVRRVGSRATRSNLDSIAEETLNDFMARMPLNQPDKFARCRRGPSDVFDLRNDAFLSSLCTCSFPATLPDMDDWDERGVPLQCDVEEAMYGTIERYSIRFGERAVYRFDPKEKGYF
eukprot:1011740-Amphidinium_carterae.1